MKKTKNIRRFLVAIFAIIVIATSFIGCDGGFDNLPEVVSTSPSSGSTGASINGNITATFKESMDPASITSSTFTVSKGGSNIAGIVTYDVPNKKAIFAPSALFDNSKEYTATLTTGVKTTANIAMKANKVWSFTSAPAGIGPAPVLLGTAGNYVILAKTAISNVPSSVITGDLGLSPEALSFITGFSHTLATGYATSPQVTGFIYAADMVAPTSSNLTTAIGDMLLGYADASDRAVSAANLNLAVGDIGGKTFLPGVYKWTSSVTTTTDSDLTISGGANDTWIFQINQNLSLGANRKIILAGGAQAKNIVWQVKGDVSIGTGAHIEGIVLCEKQINMGTNASVNGRLLAQTLIALDQNTVKQPVL